MDGVFIGAGWSRDMRNMMLAAFIGYVAALAVARPCIRQSRPLGRAQPFSCWLRGAFLLPDGAAPGGSDVPAAPVVERLSRMSRIEASFSRSQRAERPRTIRPGNPGPS